MVYYIITDWVYYYNNPVLKEIIDLNPICSN
jgi:hypothetical protein